ncbi:CBH1-6 protein, partial [Fistulina hepatica ATCC 64428]
LLPVVIGQQVGTYATESHSSLTIVERAFSGSYTTSSRSIVLDSNWRWTHITNRHTNYYTGNERNTTICPDPVAC